MTKLIVGHHSNIATRHANKQETCYLFLFLHEKQSCKDRSSSSSSSSSSSLHLQEYFLLQSLLLLLVLLTNDYGLAVLPNSRKTISKILK
jgi:hypothetical protein